MQVHMPGLHIYVNGNEVSLQMSVRAIVLGPVLLGYSKLATCKVSPMGIFRYRSLAL